MNDLGYSNFASHLRRKYPSVTDYQVEQIAAFIARSLRAATLTDVEWIVTALALEQPLATRLNQPKECF